MRNATTAKGTSSSTGAPNGDSAKKARITIAAAQQARGCQTAPVETVWLE
jgi:hypothetical protein